MGSRTGTKIGTKIGAKAGWYKVFSGLPQEAKLAVVARHAGFRRGEVLAVWVALLDYASAAKPRGNVQDADPEEIAAALECDAAAVASVITTLYDRKMILPDGMLFNWDKHQDLSTPRTRACRARKAAAAIYEVSGETDAARRTRLINQMQANKRVQP